MRIRKILLVYVILIILITPILTSSVLSFNNSNILTNENLPNSWNKEWSFRQEIILPISTEYSHAKFQPIDIKIEFDHNCWASDKKNHSIRICCWDGKTWYELESQIYDLNSTYDNYINNCRLIFLVPEIANGEERYFVYYDDSEKPLTKYIDHLNIEDAYYYYEPISGISVEGDYYKITEDGYIVYGIGQKGHAMNRRLSQIILKMKPNTEEFDIMSSDVLASFSFSYQNGIRDEDEISSDQILISKNITEDGNLMVEFGIISESSTKDLRTTNIYKYYYCPTDNKRIRVNVKHEVLEEGRVKGIEDLDGRYGTLISFKSKSTSIKKMCFGDILPFVHIYGENNRIKEYQMNENPETKEREWIISHLDDCDLGENAWISYDEGDIGKTHAILFPSNEDIVKEGTNERDGIEVKVAEEEYLNIVGTEIDYASIAFGRNSFIEGGHHDLTIPNNLVVEFDAEFFSMEEGNYENVDKESEIFRKLANYFDLKEDTHFEGDKNIHTLTVISHLSGRIFAFPNLEEITGLPLPIIWAELYQNNTLISSVVANKPFIGIQLIKFPKIAPGEYVVRLYRKIGNKTKNYIGVGSVTVENDTNLHIYCTWEKNIEIAACNQYNKNIENIELILLRDDMVVIKNLTTSSKNLILEVPFNLFDSYVWENIENITIKSLFNLSDPYVLEAFYKGFLIYDKEILMKQRKVEINLDLYELTVEIKDELDFPPGVDLKPFLTSPEMYDTVEILPMDIGKGKYLFEGLPSATYDLHISYGRFSEKESIIVPEIGDSMSMVFNGLFDIRTKLLNAYGENLQNNNQEISIHRNGRKVYQSLSPGDAVSLPPGKYTINVYSKNELIGSKTIELLNDKNIKIITIVESLLPFIVRILSFIFIGVIFLLIFYKKISLNTTLKLIAISIILISLFQPWWILNSSSDDGLTEKTSSMYIFSQTMIDRISYQDEVYLDLATIPEEFTDFLGVLLIIISSGLVLLGISFIPNVVLRRRFSLILVSASILFIVLVNAAFSYGMSKICEISLGSLRGEGVLDLSLPTGETVYMSSAWGLGNGFYICVISSIILISAGFIDFIIRRKLIKRLYKKKK